MEMFVGLFRPSPLVASAIFLVLGFIVGGALSLFVIYSNILTKTSGTSGSSSCHGKTSWLPKANLPQTGAPGLSQAAVGSRFIEQFVEMSRTCYPLPAASFATGTPVRLLP